MLSTHDYEKMIEYVGGDPESMTCKTEKSMIGGILMGLMNRTHIVDLDSENINSSKVGDAAVLAWASGKTLVLLQDGEYCPAIAVKFATYSPTGNIKLPVMVVTHHQPNSGAIAFVQSRLYLSNAVAAHFMDV